MTFEKQGSYLNALNKNVYKMYGSVLRIEMIWKQYIYTHMNQSITTMLKCFCGIVLCHFMQQTKPFVKISH